MWENPAVLPSTETLSPKPDWHTHLRLVCNAAIQMSSDALIVVLAVDEQLMRELYYIIRVYNRPFYYI
jgi:hypothetical protein